MIADADVRVAASEEITEAELRVLIDAELSEHAFETDDVRLVLASDLLCDAALEVASRASDSPTIKKVFSFGGVRMQLTEMSIFMSVERDFKNGKISEQEVQALLLRSSVANAISNAVEAGFCASDVAKSEIELASVGLADLSKPNRKELLSRLFGRVWLRSGFRNKP